MQTTSDVIIVGGGLAGLACGIHLSKKGLSVTVLEKSSYPKHKVCGEYVSNEVLSYLKWLGIDTEILNPVSINKFLFSSQSGTVVTANLPLGGFGISRFALDDFLHKTALSSGCRIETTTVTGINFIDDRFTVATSGKIYNAGVVIGAFGKRSNMDQQLSRDFMSNKSPWLAVKAHYKGEFPDDVVALHNFPGGYCGISKVEGNNINICYLANYKSFKRYRNIKDFEEGELYKNPHLKSIFEKSTMLFDKPLTISQISFDKKKPVENHVLMIGDTAGLIHPFCGNGMAMAIHSAKIAADLVFLYFAGTIKSRKELEIRYERQWEHNFERRLRAARVLSRALQRKLLTKTMMGLVTIFPDLLPKLIKRTHGNPIKVAC